MEPLANARGPVRSTRLRQRLDSGGVAVAVASHSLTSDTVDFLGQFGRCCCSRGQVRTRRPARGHQRPSFVAASRRASR